MTAPTSPAPPPIGNPDSRTDKPRVTAVSTHITPAPTTPAPAAAHWTEAALAELRFDLDLLAKMDDLRAKVTRTHAALTTYGITDLPPLPWKCKPPPKK